MMKVNREVKLKAAEMAKRACVKGFCIVGDTNGQAEVVPGVVSGITMPTTRGCVTIAISSLPDGEHFTLALPIMMHRKDATDFARRILAACEEAATGE